jgi:hypothetical protein
MFFFEHLEKSYPDRFLGANLYRRNIHTEGKNEKKPC